VRGLSPQFGEEGLKHAINVLDDVVVPYADDAVTESGQITVALSIYSVFGVLTAIDLDDDMPVTAREINIIRPDRLLTREFEPAEPAIPKIAPKLRFCRCEGTA
jgi:hypothetical protein